MPITLNFSDDEKEKVKKVLAGCERCETKTPYEEFRCRHEGITVTVYTSGKVLVQGKEERKFADSLLESLKLKEEVVLGIDEAGRGERFGPFVVAAVLADRNRMRELRDSKKIAKAGLGDKYALVIKNAKKSASVSVSAAEIDRLRASGENMNAIEARLIDDLVAGFKGAGSEYPVRVDGAELPVKTKGIEFIPGGDDKDPVIGAASVLAKYVREHSEDGGERKSWKKIGN